MKKILFMLVLVFLFSSTAYAKSFSNELAEKVVQEYAKKEIEKESKWYKEWQKEYKAWKDGKRPNTISMPESWEESLKYHRRFEKIQDYGDFENYIWSKRFYERAKNRGENGFWYRWGSRTFGKWVLYTPDNLNKKKLIKFKENTLPDKFFSDTRLYFEIIIWLPSEEIETLYESFKEYLNPDATSKREALLELTLYDYEMHEMSGIEKAVNTLGNAIEKVTGTKSASPTIPVYPIPVGF